MQFNQQNDGPTGQKIFGMQFDMQPIEIEGDESESDDEPTIENRVTTGVGEGEVNFDNMVDKSPSTSSSSCAENLAF